MGAAPRTHDKGELKQERHQRRWRQMAACTVAAVLITAGLQAVHPWRPSSDLLRELSLNIYIFAAALTGFVLFQWRASRREEMLREQSITDPLTGLCNRRYFTHRLHTELMRSNRSKTALALLLIDIDHLKVVNDSQGHHAGDIIIQRVAACIHQVCRSTDVLARLGGDEFAVLAPATQAAQAVELASRLRANLHACSSPALPLSVSIGVSDLSTVRSPSAESLLGAADSAMYRAKQQGRDTVVVSDIADASASWAPLPGRNETRDQDRALSG